MDFQEMCQKQDEAVAKIRENDTPENRTQQTAAFLDAAIDFFNENLTGDVTLADGRTAFIPAIEN